MVRQGVHKPGAAFSLRSLSLLHCVAEYPGAGFDECFNDTTQYSVVFDGSNCWTLLPFLSIRLSTWGPAVGKRSLSKPWTRFRSIFLHANEKPLAFTSPLVVHLKLCRLGDGLAPAPAAAAAVPAAVLLHCLWT